MSPRALAPHSVLQTRIAATDHEIDRLVYELYGLTEGELKIVEPPSPIVARAFQAAYT